MGTVTIDLDTLLPLRTVAQRLGIGKEHVMRLARAGALPAIDTPLGRLFDPVEVERYRLEREARRGTSNSP